MEDICRATPKELNAQPLAIKEFPAFGLFGGCNQWNELIPEFFGLAFELGFLVLLVARSLFGEDLVVGVWSHANYRALQHQCLVGLDCSAPPARVS